MFAGFFLSFLPLFFHVLLDSLNFEAHSDVTAQHHNEDGRKKGEKIVYRLTNFQFNASRGKTIDERKDQNFGVEAFATYWISVWMLLFSGRPEEKKKK